MSHGRSFESWKASGLKLDMLFNWNRVRTSGIEQTKPPAGTFFDETLRDGIQAPNIRNPALDQKLQLVDHMVRCGIRSADIGFPGSGPAAAGECLALAKYIVANNYPLTQGFAGRTHPSDIHAICDVAQAAGTPVEAYIFIGVSPIRQYVEDWSIESITRDIRLSVAECRREGVEFVLVLEDTVRCTPEILAQVYEPVPDLGISRITLCDTVGAALPSGTEALIGWSTRYFADRHHPVAFEWHGHNDRGLALINSLTALASGCERVHGTVLGVGERAGNASIDQLIVNSRLEYSGNHDTKALRQYCEYAADVLGFDIPVNYPAMGQNVFKTSAGVHASAILKAHEKRDAFLEDSVYSSVPASLLGREQEVLIDPSSGVSNVRYWLAVNGRDIGDSLIQEVLRTAKRSGRPLNDEEIRQIIATGE